MTQRQIVITERNLGLWITIILLIIGSVADSVKIREQVKLNSLLLEKYPPEIFFANEKNIMEDMKEIKEDIKGLRGEIKQLSAEVNKNYTGD